MNIGITTFPDTIISHPVSILNKASTLFTNFTAMVRQRNISPSSTPRNNTHSKMSKQFGKTPFKIIGLIAGLLVIVLFVLKIYKTNPSSTSSAPQVQGITDQLAVAGPIKKLDLNQSYQFPLTDKEGNEISTLYYEIESVELRDEIIVSGKKAYAVEGRDFLIVNLKIKNDYNKSIKINSRDYIRLQKNGNTQEKLAPEIHNDPVDVQAISTKNTRLGFNVNETDKDLVLQVGEIEGDKQFVPIKFK